MLVAHRDHPRSRGVYGQIRPRAVRMAGSSPLARGLPEDGLRRELLDGIIPARAGFTGSRATSPTGWADHPRSRGVYRIARDFADRMGGSSPLARGLPAAHRVADEAVRIIPARAGFTRCSPGGWGRGSDHPRSRGVYVDGDYVTIPPSGSSPLARGLHVRPVSVLLRHRIIPARAGFTPGPHRQGRLRRDHPRSRGVYAWSASRSLRW